MMVKPSNLNFSVYTFGLLILFRICEVFCDEEETTTIKNSIQTEDYSLNLQGRNQACNILFSIDEPLWQQYDKNMTALVNLAKDHINGLNRIFSQQVFVEDYENIYFNLKRVEIKFGSCESHILEKEYDKNCTEQRENFLSAYDQSTDTSDFCLAYLLTYRDFHNGTAGLASIGTVCRPIQNSGFVTMLNYNQNRSLDESIKTLAHEVAHNFDATHDNEYEDDEECYNQGFIMDELYNSTNTENSANFSKCSLTKMSEKLQNLEIDTCLKSIDFDADFKDLEISQCGNHVVDPGEECDCGLTEKDCNDPCCYPAYISNYERSLNSSAKSCFRTERYWCRTRPEMVYGFYLPWAVMLFATILIFGILYRDFHREKRFFKHITETRVRIID